MKQYLDKSKLSKVNCQVVLHHTAHRNSLWRSNFHCHRQLNILTVSIKQPILKYAQRLIRSKLVAFPRWSLEGFFSSQKELGLDSEETLPSVH